MFLSAVAEFRILQTLYTEQVCTSASSELETGYQLTSTGAYLILNQILLSEQNSVSIVLEFCCSIYIRNKILLFEQNSELCLVRILQPQTRARSDLSRIRVGSDAHVKIFANLTRPRDVKIRQKFNDFTKKDVTFLTLKTR